MALGASLLALHKNVARENALAHLERIARNARVYSDLEGQRVSVNTLPAKTGVLHISSYRNMKVSLTSVPPVCLNMPHLLVLFALSRE